MNIKISYVTVYNAFDIHKFSGSSYAIARMLEDQSAELDFIGNLKTPLRNILKIKQRIYKIVQGKFFDINREPFVAKQYAYQVKSRMRPDTDIVFSPSSIPTALLESNKPKVFYTDATFAGLLGFYGNYSNLCKETIDHGNYLEQKALESAKLIIYSSDWAAKTAIDNYTVNPAKIKVVPFGANIDCNRNLNTIKDIVNKRSRSLLKLLFIGLDWKRKGGDLAVKIACMLNQLGLKTVLHIVGINKLPFKELPDFVINHGYINKYTTEGKNRMNELFAESHFLLVPSVAEAYGLVFCEANSFGIPCISTNVGGIPMIIKDEINGKTFTPSTNVEEWCNYILTCFRDYERYCSICLTSFDEYQKRLNWDVAGKSVMNLIRNL
jgi:glycosyltransferase involved in cell wall biosynthesis